MGYSGRPLRPSPADHVLYLRLLGSRHSSPLLSSLSSLHAHLGQHNVSTHFLGSLSCGGAFRAPGRIHRPHKPGERNRWGPSRPEAISVSEPSEQLEGQTDWFTILSQAKVRASGS